MMLRLQEEGVLTLFAGCVLPNEEESGGLNKTNW